MKVTDKISSILHNTNPNALALLHFNQINKQSFCFVYWVRNKYYQVAQAIFIVGSKKKIIKQLLFETNQSIVNITLKAFYNLWNCDAEK